VAPLQGAGGLGRFPGLKPWLKPRAESCSPFGAKTRSIISIASSSLGSASNFVTPSFGAPDRRPRFLRRIKLLERKWLKAIFAPLAPCSQGLLNRITAVDN
jgi:hypothetical protein